MRPTPPPPGRARAPAPKPRRAPAPRAARPTATAAITPRGRLVPRPTLVLAALVAGYALLFSIVTLIKYRCYLYTDFDLALFAQAVDRLRFGSTWNTVRGMDWRGDHSSLLLYLIAPLTWLADRAPALLVLQSVVLALGAIPVYRLAKRLLADDALALVCAALYLAHPALGYTNLFEFHPETLVTTTLLAALEALFAGRLALTLLFGALSLLGKEDGAVPVLGLALLAVALRRRLPAGARPWLAAAGLAGLAAVSLVISFAWFKPAFVHGEIDSARMYGLPGAAGGAGDVFRTLLAHPLRTIQSLWSTPDNATDSLMKRQFHLEMLLPLGFLPLLGPAPLLLGALPVVAQHFVSARMPQHTIVHQYTAYVTPFLLAATVMGLDTIRRWSAARRLGRLPVRAAAVLALAGSLAANLMFGPLFGHGIQQRYAPTERWKPNPKDALLRPYRDRMVARIPRDAGVIASFEYLPRLAARANVHSFHHLFLGHYMLSEKPYALPHDIGAMISTFGDQYDAGAADRLRTIIARDRLRPVDGVDDVLCWLREPRDTMEILRVADTAPRGRTNVTFDRALTFTGCDLDTTPTPRGGTVTLRTYWRRVGAIDRLYLLRLWLVDRDANAALYRNRYLGYGLSTPDRWPADTTLRETYRIGVPGSVVPAPYRLVMQVATVHDRKAALAEADDARLNSLGGTIQLGIVDVR